MLRWPTGVTTHYLTTYFELLSMHFKLCTTHFQIPQNTFQIILNSLQILKSSQHISKSSQHISKSSQHIRPRNPSVDREKGTVTQLLLLLSTPCFVPRVDNNYKKVLFLPEMWVEACRKCRPRKLRR